MKFVRKEEGGNPKMGLVGHGGKISLNLLFFL